MAIDILKIGNTVLPEPIAGGYEVSRSDIDSSSTGRGEDGVMFRDRVRSGIYKVECTWRLESPQMSALLSAISPETFQLTFWDITTGTIVTRTVYVGDRKASLLNWIDKASTTTAGKTLCEFSCNFIEV